jgi:cell division protein FtsQ
MKISIKRGTRSSESRAGSAVLEAPEETFASETSDVEEAMPMWHGRGPAPAGALQRGFGAAGYASPDGDETLLSETPAEKEYVPRRGSFAMRVRMLFKSVGGRIVLGVVVLVFLAAIVVAGVGIRSYLMHDERFLMTTSADIQIEGNEHLTRPQVLSIFGADLERNLFRVSLAERRADLERLPWVEHATVMRLLPNRIRVAVKERTPVAFVRQGTQIGLVDAGGVLLDMPPDAAGDPKYSFPVLTGISASDPLSTRAARMEIYKRFMTELDSTGEHLTRSLSEVDISNPEDVKAVVATGNSDILVHFGDEQFLDRYHEFSQHLTEWKTQYPKLASADMRYEGQIVLEMQTGAGVPLNSDAAALAANANATAKAEAGPSAAHPTGQTTPVGSSGSPQDDKTKLSQDDKSKVAQDAKSSVESRVSSLPVASQAKPAAKAKTKAKAKPVAKKPVVKKAAVSTAPGVTP